MRLCARQPARGERSAPLLPRRASKGQGTHISSRPALSPDRDPTLHTARCTARLDVFGVAHTRHIAHPAYLLGLASLTHWLRGPLVHVVCTRYIMRLTHPSFRPSSEKTSEECYREVRRILSTSLWRTKMASSGLAQTQPGQTVAKLPSGPASLEARRRARKRMRPHFHVARPAAARGRRTAGRQRYRQPHVSAPRGVSTDRRPNPRLLPRSPGRPCPQHHRACA